MFLKAWTFLRGYVAVEVTGSSVERFLNMTAHRGIYIWDINPIKNGIQMHCSIKAFKMLKTSAQKTKCRLKVSDRQGLPFIIYRYRRRKFLMGGVAFFVLFLYIMASFIWRIDIEGNERVPTEAILQFSETYNLRIGASKRHINNREVSRAILSHFTDIGWVDVHTRGTRTTIIVSEIIPEHPRLPRDTPCNIVAAQDGLITKIVTASGIPKVRQNDVVQEGDILVSGELPIVSEHTGQSTTVFVHAYAEVWAKMYTPFRFKLPMSYTHKAFTGNERTHHTIQWLAGQQRSINLFHGRISFTNYDKIVSHNQPGSSGDYPMPFIWTQAIYREFIPETRHRTLEEAKAMADRIITDRIIREFDFHIDIVDKLVQFEELPDNLVVSVLITTNERIDKAVPIENPLHEN
ncbi:MAG: sporulation protein YqfD [Defluviitaleaceae bacterium]|nr:sporulation protein YqfD [Defluviitaleaceae bacterium]